MTGIIQDLRYAVRQFGKSPGLTRVAVTTLALAIGANIAIFGVVNATLLQRLLYKESDRLVMVREQNPHRGWYRHAPREAYLFHSKVVAEEEL